MHFKPPNGTIGGRSVRPMVHRGSGGGERRRVDSGCFLKYIMMFFSLGEREVLGGERKVALKYKALL